jgi:hypothetical protein
MYTAEKKTILSIMLKNLILVFLSLFHVVMFFHFPPLNFILIYVLFFIQIDYFSLVNFTLNLRK